MKSSVPPVLIHPSVLLCSSECKQAEKNCHAHEEFLLSCEAVSEQNETPIKFLLDYIHSSTLPKELFGANQGDSKQSPYAVLKLESPVDAATSFRSSREVLACNVKYHQDHQFHETPQKSQSPSQQQHIRSVQLIDSLSADESLRKRQELSRELKNNPLLEEFLQLLVEQPLEDYVPFGHVKNIGSQSINSLDSQSSIKSKALTTKEGWSSSEENAGGETISIPQFALEYHQSRKTPLIKPFIDGQSVGSQDGYDYAQSMLNSLKESLGSLREVLEGKCARKLFQGVQLENQEERAVLDNVSLLSTRQLMSQKKIIQKSYHKKRMVDSC